MYVNISYEKLPLQLLVKGVRDAQGNYLTIVLACLSNFAGRSQLLKTFYNSDLGLGGIKTELVQRVIPKERLSKYQQVL